MFIVAHDVLDDFVHPLPLFLTYFPTYQNNNIHRYLRKRDTTFHKWSATLMKTVALCLACPSNEKGSATESVPHFVLQIKIGPKCHRVKILR
jgi:hypothetical protein